MPKRIYFVSMGETVGPVTGAQLREQAVKGIVMPDTFVRIGDDGEWVRAARLTDLFDAEGNPIGPKSSRSKTPAKVRRDGLSFPLTKSTIALTIVVSVVVLVLLIWWLTIIF